MGFNMFTSGNNAFDRTMVSSESPPHTVHIVPGTEGSIQRQNQRNDHPYPKDSHTMLKMIDRTPSFCGIRSASPTSDLVSQVSDGSEPPVSRGGVVTPFPWKLHDMLERIEEDGYGHIVSWQPHGRCFAVHNPTKFVEQVMPIYFNQTKFASFQRQLNLYGFHRLTTGRDKGAYYHESFLRSKRHLISQLTRQKIKGTKVRRAMAPALEPNFYGMPYMPDNKNDQVHMPSTDTARRLMTRTVTSDTELVKLVPDEQVCFFEGKPFHFLDQSNIQPPSQDDASSLRRENTVIRGWMKAIAQD